MKGDIILSVNDIKINKFHDIPKAIGNNENVIIEVLRNNLIINKSIQLKFDKKLNRKIIGITSTSNVINDQFNLINSLKESCIYFFSPNS